MEKEKQKEKQKEKINYNKNDIPLSFRVPLKLHKKYKGIKSIHKKSISLKFVSWLNKQIDLEKKKKYF